jgi:hypothetical protein
MLWAWLSRVWGGWAEEIAHLRELNRIRNKLAHQLPSKPGHHANIEKWACAVVGYTPKTIDRRGDVSARRAQGAVSAHRLSVRCGVDGPSDQRRRQKARLPPNLANGLVRRADSCHARHLATSITNDAKVCWQTGVLGITHQLNTRRLVIRRPATPIPCLM